jgi:flagellar biosynthesis protein FliQ
MNLKSKNNLKKLIMVSLFTAILFVQEELLTFIPDVQFTFMLVMLYGATMGPLYGSIIVVLHVIFDNLFIDI